MEGDFGTSSLITFDLAVVVAWHGAVAVLRLGAAREKCEATTCRRGALGTSMAFDLLGVCVRFHAASMQRAKITGEKKWSFPSLAHILWQICRAT